MNNSDKLIKIKALDPQNKYCVDCKNLSQNWIDIKIGCYLCTRCAGLHRKFGTDYCRVKSITLDKWTNEEIEFMKSIGNTKINEQYEANLKKENKIDITSEDKLTRFIKNKYIDKIFYSKINKQINEKLSESSSKSENKEVINDVTNELVKSKNEKMLIDFNEPVSIKQNYIDDFFQPDELPGVKQPSYDDFKKSIMEKYNYPTIYNNTFYNMNEQQYKFN